MLVFAASDKGGTGRTVAGCNVAYHLAQRYDVAYLDFDFGSPTAGTVFEITRAGRGVDRDGLHSYFTGTTADPQQINVWQSTSRNDLRAANVRAGRLVLIPGDRGGGEFQITRSVARCVELFARLDAEFDVCIVDLSAGRSYAVDMVLRASADAAMRAIRTRWLVFHRWTRQHIVAASGLVHDPHGIIEAGVNVGHDKNELLDAIRFVRTAVPNLNSPLITGAAQATWLRACDDQLKRLAVENKLGRSSLLGSTPMEPVLQWREQVISDADVAQKIASADTVRAFRELAGRLVDEAYWEGL